MLPAPRRGRSPEVPTRPPLIRPPTPSPTSLPTPATFSARHPASFGSQAHQFFPASPALSHQATGPLLEGSSKTVVTTPLGSTEDVATLDPILHESKQRPSEVLHPIVQGLSEYGERNSGGGSLETFPGGSGQHYFHHHPMIVAAFSTVRICTNGAKAVYRCMNQDRDCARSSPQAHAPGTNKQCLRNGALEEAVKLINSILTPTVGLFNIPRGKTVGPPAQGAPERWRGASGSRRSASVTVWEAIWKQPLSSRSVSLPCETDQPTIGILNVGHLADSFLKRKK